ncbi:RagB/SusD family nutrient uptake outer membrane protein [Hymenobacter weizhouensis]|uniref:RagB/SusD family nutrient uptake outer membrane protein n=1 Tax=Hymenobacter sp. YIM 151500-1 TaxID=2987689 RepID=UPI002227CF04|nr:RagB/SusD family nutrient uptake outer membrane protein [Hymenobacter sp. YIM 151500-1]UYZ63272.1 RagB/SusD family nutrient uptake outer membrane protein [Hymenobacter sp. YIM 151500-1]
MHYIARKLAVIALLLGTTACGFFETDVVEDPNNPPLDRVLNNATSAQLNALAVGVEASYRNHHTTNAPYNWVAGVLGREILVLAATESRWYGELQGTRGRLDDAAYYNAYYVPLAQMRRAAQVFRESANNSQAYDDQQKRGVAGFTYTYEALAHLLLLNMQGENGIRIDVNNVLRPGRFVDQPTALTEISRLLDLGATELNQAGSTFAFTLSPGFRAAPSGVAGQDFSTPATFRRFNRALAARVALYQRDFSKARAALGESFYDPTASLTIGPKITFNPAVAGDQGNPYFQARNNTGSTVVGVPKNFINEAEPGDLRLSKVRLRDSTNITPRGPGARVTGGISSVLEAFRFTTITDPLDIIRNEELILISAEVHANSGRLSDALADINVIRTRAGGLPALPVGSFTSPEVAIDEIVRQRRYSLFYEGQYAFDLRRLGRLPTTAQTAPVRVAPRSTPPYPFTPQTLAFSAPVGQVNYRLFDRLERPAAEKAWDAANP